MPTAIHWMGSRRVESGNGWRTKVKRNWMAPEAARARASGSTRTISVPVPAQRFYEQEKLIAQRLLATRRLLDEQLAAAA